MSKILITGGTGLVGTRLTQMLVDRNHDVVILSRNPKNKNEFKWDFSKNYVNTEAFKNVDYIIHLAGAGIADERWNAERKKIIIDSRVKTANLIFNAIKENSISIKGFISASGIGYYGAVTTTTIFKETDTVGNDFLGDVCKKWEDAAHQFSTESIPVTILRTGIVLAKKGGALNKMLPAFKLCLGGPIGNGEQGMSWIHIDDMIQLILFIIKHPEISGPVNATAPNPVSNAQFSESLGEALSRPAFITMPTAVLKLLMGEMSDLLTTGQFVVPKKALVHNYRFHHPDIKSALESLV